MPTRFQAAKAADINAGPVRNHRRQRRDVARCHQGRHLRRELGSGTNRYLTLQAAAEDWLNVITRTQKARWPGKLKLKDDMRLAMNLGSVFAV